VTQYVAENVHEELINFIGYLFKRGTSAFLTVFGRRETGKTNFALLIAEIVHFLGIIKNFATNIKIYSSPFEIQHITNLYDLEQWCIQTRGKKLFIFDEFGKAMRRRTPMASLNLKLIDKFQVLRKYKLSIIACTTDPKYVDNAALGEDILDGAFLKIDYKNPEIAIYKDLLEGFQKNIVEIPPTSISYDTWDVAPFTEKPPLRKPIFKNRDLEILWEWSHGKTYKDLGLHRMQLNRLLRKFVKRTLESQCHRSPLTEQAANIAEIEVTNTAK